LTSRPPVWMMRQAGRYLPEYQEIRKQADFLTMVHTPSLAVEVSLQPIQRFPLDACIVFSDILNPLVPLGVHLEFLEGEGPRLSPPLRTEAQIEGLAEVKVEKELGYVGETLRLLRSQLPESVALLGFAGAPFTLASYLIEGGGSKHFVEVHRMMYQNPRLFARLLEKLSVLLKAYLRLQISAGAQALQIFDTWGGFLSLPDYERYALPFLQDIFQDLKPLGVPLILYIHQGSHLLPAYLKSGADVASLDWRVSLREARSFFQDQLMLQGNLNPLLLFGSLKEVRAHTKALLDSVRHPQEGGYQGFIFNLGHGILPKTPLEAVLEMLSIIHEEAS
jgi:uroporphyrinogen decarboxylase